VLLAPDEQNLDDLFQALADRRAWQRVIHEKLLLQITVNQESKAKSKIEEATRAVSARVPETWCHLLAPYQNKPGPHGAEWDEKQLSGGKGSLAERASKKCNDEDWLSEDLATLTIRQKLDAFLWRDRVPTCSA